MLQGKKKGKLPVSLNYPCYPFVFGTLLYYLLQDISKYTSTFGRNDNHDKTICCVQVHVPRSKVKVTAGT